MSTAIRVLEISPWENTISQNVYPDAEITRWDFASPVPEEYFGTFDAVMADNVLQRFGYMSAVATINSWKKCLKEGGELHIIVPSLEWACREILSEKPSPASMVVLYGGQGADASIHASGYTMRLLRAHLDRCDLSCTKARTADTDIKIGEVVYKINQHYVCAVNGIPELKKS